MSWREDMRIARAGQGRFSPFLLQHCRGRKIFYEETRKAGEDGLLTDIPGDLDAAVTSGMLSIEIPMTGLNRCSKTPPDSAANTNLRITAPPHHIGRFSYAAIQSTFFVIFPPSPLIAA
jgi:hypothetical protein